jgi:hypothetical protein
LIAEEPLHFPLALSAAKLFDTRLAALLQSPLLVSLLESASAVPASVLADDEEDVPDKPTNKEDAKRNASSNDLDARRLLTLPFLLNQSPPKLLNKLFMILLLLKPQSSCTLPTFTL